MNPKEALAYIEPRLKEWCDYRESHSDVWHDNKNAQDYEALATLKELVDRDTPAKPKLGYLPSRIGRVFGDVALYTCPRCGNCMLTMFANDRQRNDYCWNCGKALDWSKE